MSATLAWFMVFATMLGISAGQILFKLGAEQLKHHGAPTPVPFLNGPIALALAIYLGSTVIWIAALRELPLRLAYPVSALAYVVVPLLSHFFLNEPLGFRSLAGAALIIAGIAVATSGS